MMRGYYDRVTCFAYRFGKGKYAVKRLHSAIIGWALTIYPMPLRGRRALDIGCAFGYTVKLLKDLGCECVGVDLSSFAARVARKSKGDFEVAVGDAENLPFRGNSFDIVTSFELIEHLYHPGYFVGEVYRILKHGGVLIMTTPIRGSLRQVYDFFGEGTHISLFRPDELISMLGHYSFKVHGLIRFTILPIPPHLFGRYLMVWKLPWNILSTNIAIVAEKK
jgi:2-polyprenyl-3-methyl-5-hydroxy-6-metoxy-1,4-benzoquinol methylase